MIAISIGDPVISSGDGNTLFLYGGIIAGVAAAVLLWWYLNRRKSKE